MREICRECASIKGRTERRVYSKPEQPVLSCKTTMFTRLLTTLTLALFCAATPVVVRDTQISLPVSRQFKFDASKGSTIVQIDQARAKALKAKTRVPADQFKATAQSAAKNLPVTNIATIYTAEVRCLFHFFRISNIF